MRAHYLQHVPFEGLGSIKAWLQHAGYEITCTRLFAFDELPGVDEIDLLIIMGGPMSVNDEASYPWLPEEKRFIKNAIGSGLSTLGICLGAQLIANALGSDVYPNAVKEIGWFPVYATGTQDNTAFLFPDEITAFHWHGETFDLPDGAVRLAESEGCKNQAFQVGSNVIGLQFHLETTPDSARALVEHCGHELVGGEFIQTATEILSASEQRYGAISELMGRILAHLHALRRQAAE